MRAERELSERVARRAVLEQHRAVGRHKIDGEVDFIEQSGKIAEIEGKRGLQTVGNGLFLSRYPGADAGNGGNADDEPGGNDGKRRKRAIKKRKQRHRRRCKQHEPRRGHA